MKLNQTEEEQVQLFKEEHSPKTIEEVTYNSSDQQHPFVKNKSVILFLLVGVCVVVFILAGGSTHKNTQEINLNASINQQIKKEVKQNKNLNDTKDPKQNLNQQVGQNITTQKSQASEIDKNQQENKEKQSTKDKKDNDKQNKQDLSKDNKKQQPLEQQKHTKEVENNKQEEEQKNNQQEKQKKQQQEEQKKKRQQDEQKQRLQAEQKKKQVEEQKKKNQEEEKKKQEEEKMKKQHEEEEKKKKQQEQKRKQQEEQKKKKQEEQKKKKQEQQQKKKQQEQKKKQQEQKKKQQEEQKKKAQEEQKKKQQEQQKKKLQDEQKKKRHEEEQGKKGENQQSKKKEQNEKQAEQKEQKQQTIKAEETVLVQKEQQKNVESTPQSHSQTLTTSSTSEFIIPSYVWTYVENISSESIFVKRCIENIKYFSKLSNFQFKIINNDNFKDYLSKDTFQKITKVIQILSKRLKDEPESNLKDHYENIKRRLIVFHILNEKGGIFLQKNVLFTQSFDWIKSIHNNPYVNKGSMDSKAKYIGFFDIDHGSAIVKHNRTGIKYETQKYMIEYPNFQPYFLAAIANGQYLTSLLNFYFDLLEKPSSLEQTVKKYPLTMGGLQGKDFYYEIFYICQNLVLVKKQSEIDSNEGNKQDNIFSIDYFGLFTINERYFPKKLQFTFQNNHEFKIFWNLGKYTLKELEETSGPLSYIVCMMFEGHITYKLDLAYKGQKDVTIHPDSFLGKYVVLNNSQPFIEKDLEKNQQNEKGEPWTNLPKIIWVFWDSGIKNSSLGNKLCVDNIRRYGKQSGFQIRELNNSNIEQHIGKELNSKIDKFIQNKKITTFAQTKSDMVRIAIIAKHGGIYMDASYFALQNFDWIINIAKYPSQSVFNRYGTLPKILMFFHPHFGQPFTWTFDKDANTKNMWLSAYENNLLIAEPNQQLFWDWLDEYGRFVTTPYQETENIMKQYEVFSDRWTNKDNEYLAAMDSVKNVIGKKQHQIREEMKNKDYKGPKSAAEYYGIWSLSGYRGQQKLRAHTNFDNTYNAKPHNSDNLFLWRYSEAYATGIIGKVHHLVKLYGWNIKYLNMALLKSIDSNFTSEIHPESFFMKYLYDPTKHKIKKVGEDLQLDYLAQ